jgi:hypothetical protein
MASTIFAFLAEVTRLPLDSHPTPSFLGPRNGTIDMMVSQLVRLFEEFHSPVAAVLVKLAMKLALLWVGLLTLNVC